MKITTLDLIDFRNYPKAHITFGDGVNILVGKNAQGKTNVLEAIHFLATSRSFRTRHFKEAIRFDQPFAVIEGRADGFRSTDLRIVLSQEGKKTFVNGASADNAGDFIGYLNAVLFVPEDLMMVKGSPKLRRRLLDDELSKMSPIYLYSITKYRQLVKERNACLKVLKDKKQDGDLVLDVLSEQLADTQVNLIRKRAVFTKRLSQAAGTIYKDISAGEELTIAYKCSYKKADKGVILEKYRKTVSRDIAYAQTVDGLHKDDLVFRLDGQDAGQFASQGQQRSIVLAVKMAILDIIQEDTGDYPVLLLDDVLSELDAARQTKLLAHIEHKVQTMMTTTSITGIDHPAITNATIITVDQGRTEQ